MASKSGPRFFFSAAEPSGDRHAAAVVRQLKKQIPQVACDALGGEAMADAGCNLLENLTGSSAMLFHAVGQVFFYWKLLTRVKRYLRTQKPDLVVLVDSPAWNFHVAKAARALQIPVLYYIAPQLWAWGAWRTRKLRRRVDRVACILPFEEQWFTNRGIPAEYVGHPLFDDHEPPEQINEPIAEMEGTPVVALLPGSRGHEIEHLWQPMQQIAARIREKHPAARFLTAAHTESYAQMLRASSDARLGIEIRRTSIDSVVSRADLTVVASGTATLEVAAQHCPMIVMYHVSPVQWHLLGRWVLRTKYISLVNILADKELVPEFVPFSGAIDPIVEAALHLLGDKQKQQQMRGELGRLIEPIRKSGAARNVVRMVEEMLR